VHFRVQAFYNHYAGDRMVSPDQSAITFINAYTVNGIYVDCDWAELCFSPFGELWLSSPSPSFTQRASDLLVPYVEFYESLTPEECLEGSDFNFSPGVVREAVRGIPVSTIEFIEGNWFERVRAA
jgi:hypothetical protein